MVYVAKEHVLKAIVIQLRTPLILWDTHSKIEEPVDRDTPRVLSRYGQ